MKNCVAVIGANGFLGRHLTKALLTNKENVLAVYNHSYDKIDENAILLSIEAFLLSDYEPKEIYFSVGNYSSSHSELNQLNGLLYSVSLKFSSSKIIYISSTNVYGMHKDPIYLHSAFNNPGLYAISKISGEFIASAHDKYVVLRLTYLYGKGLDNNSFIPKLIANSQEKGVITLFGNGTREQDYLHVDDAVALCIASADLPTNEILIGATGTSTSNATVASLISLYNNCQIQYSGIETGESFRFEVQDTIEKTGWSPEKSFADEIKKMLS